MDSQEEETLVDISLSEVCPICIEGDKLFKLSCSHYIHLECAKDMTDASCPICRASLEKDLPGEILSSIVDRGQEYQANLEAEDRERLGLQIDPRRAFTIFVRPRPHIEVIAAMNHLRRENVPLEFLPQKITIKKPKGHPPPQPGTIFQLLVGQAISRMKALAECSSSDSDSVSEDEEEPRIMQGVIDIIDVDPETYEPLSN